MKEYSRMRKRRIKVKPAPRGLKQARLELTWLRLVKGVAKGWGEQLILLHLDQHLHFLLLRPPLALPTIK